LKGCKIALDLSPEYLELLRRDLVIDTELRGQRLTFATTWGLFSPKVLDTGTRLLLDHIEVNEADDTIDLGCGYGPIGLTLARLAPLGTSFLIDKDFVAVEYSRRNAEKNAIHNVKILLSNGFDQVPRQQFDLVVSNLPAKTGKEQYYLYFADALKRLRPGGRFYVVTISGLRRFIERSFKGVFGNYTKVKQGKTYTVALARAGDEPS